MIPYWQPGHFPMMSSEEELAYANLMRQLQLPDARNTWIFINPWTSGDIYLQMALMDAFLAHHCQGGEKVLLLIDSKYVEIAQMFGQFPQVTIRVMDKLSAQYRLCLTLKSLSAVFCPGLPIVFMPHFMGDGKLIRFTHLRGIAVAEIAKYLLNLPFDAPLVAPQLPAAFRQRAAQIASRQNIPAGRSVLLVPHTVTLPTLADEFWQSLAADLSAAGYAVYTDTANGRFPAIAGSEGVNFSFGESLPLVEHMGHVVAQHSGFVNVVAAARCRLVVCYKGPLPYSAGNEVYAIPYSAIDLKNNGFRGSDDALAVDRADDPRQAARLALTKLLA